MPLPVCSFRPEYRHRESIRCRFEGDFNGHSDLDLEWINLNKIRNDSDPHVQLDEHRWDWVLEGWVLRVMEKRVAVDLSVA